MIDFMEVTKIEKEWNWFFFLKAMTLCMLASILPERPGYNVYVFAGGLCVIMMVLTFVFQRYRNSLVTTIYYQIGVVPSVYLIIKGFEFIQLHRSALPSAIMCIVVGFSYLLYCIIRLALIPRRITIFLNKEKA